MKFKVAHNTFETASHINKKSPDYIIYRMMDKNEIYSVIQIGQKKKCYFGEKILFSKIQFGKCEHCKARGGFKIQALQINN